MFDHTKIGTLPDLIEYGKSLNISHAKIHYQESFASGDTTVIINYTSLLDKYMDFLKKIIVDVTLSEDELFYYRFQPKRLSYDMYGTTELWSAILRINNMVSSTQFTNIKIKLFTQDIFDVLNEIMILQDGSIKENRRRIYNE